MNIALDIDGCEANFIQGFINKAHASGVDNAPNHWTEWRGWNGNIERADFNRVFGQIANDTDWWMNLPVMEDTYVNFDPVAYITDRPIASKYSRQWLVEHGFPDAPVFTTGQEGASKHDIMKEHGIDLIVEDRPVNVHSINNVRGVGAIMLNRPWNPGDNGTVVLSNGFNTHRQAMAVNYMADVPHFIQQNSQAIHKVINYQA